MDDRLQHVSITAIGKRLEKAATDHLTAVSNARRLKDRPGSCDDVGLVEQDAAQ
jgi:hypothetical protein